MRVVCTLSLSVFLFACAGDDTDTPSGTDVDGTEAEGTEAEGTEAEGTEAEGTEAPGEDVVFYSYTPGSCTGEASVLSAQPGAEDGHWAAARITPGVDMTVDEIQIELAHGFIAPILDCVATEPIAVELYVTTANSPPADAAADLSYTVPAGAADGNDRTLSIFVNLAVAADDNLFVSIQLAADAETSTCVRTCSQSGAGLTNFWSNADTRPFDWESFDSIGLPTTNTYISIYGTTD